MTEWKWLSSKKKIKSIVEDARNIADLEDLIPYDPTHEDPLTVVLDRCWVMACYDNDLCLGYILLEWIDDREAVLHVCSFFGGFSGTKELAQVLHNCFDYADLLHAYIPATNRPLVILAKRLGFVFDKLDGEEYHGQRTKGTSTAKGSSASRTSH